jgi:hypothetical protein
VRDSKNGEQDKDSVAEAPGERAKTLLTLAFKDVGAAHTFDRTDALVADSFSQVKEMMDAVGLDWTNIELDIPPPQSASRGAGAGARGWGHSAGSMRTGCSGNVALSEAISNNASAVREGASVLGKLDSKLVLELVRSKQGNGSPPTPPELVPCKAR